MQINISGHHVEVTKALKSYVNSKMEKLERHSDQIKNIKVTLSVEKQRQKAEAHTHVAGTDISAQAEKSDMYASIDALVDKLDRQILKHKEKIVGRRHDSVTIDTPDESESDAA
ncbi:MAG: ribosome-associated translation inhibitor RaiA [Sinobacterium sp.]|nr:ribosome-associated translation inhibitor RaiA [Sinobacterium sp.]